MAAPDDRLELTVGAGYLAHQYGGDSDSPALVGDIGVSVWLNEHWGLAARYWRTADYELSYGWYRYPHLYQRAGIHRVVSLDDRCEHGQRRAVGAVGHGHRAHGAIDQLRWS